MNKSAQMSKSGAAAHTLPKCKCFSQLQFLHEKVINKETESNVRNDFIHQETLTSPPELSLPTTSRLQSPTKHEATSPSICSQPPSKSKRRNTQIGEENNEGNTAVDSELLMVTKDMNNQTNKMMQNANEKREENENMLFLKFGSCIG